jgi:hypothetical protein
MKANATVQKEVIETNTHDTHKRVKCIVISAESGQEYQNNVHLTDENIW